MREVLRETQALLLMQGEGSILGRSMNRQVNVGLFCELYWGTSLAEAWSFGPEQPRVLAAPDEKAPLPLYGFTLPEEPFLLAERTEHGYRIFVPPSVKLERSTKGDAFHEVPAAQLVQHGGRAWVEDASGRGARFVVTFPVPHAAPVSAPATSGAPDTAGVVDAAPAHPRTPAPARQ